MASGSSSQQHASRVFKSMQGMSIVKVQGRQYRVSTQSLQAASHINRRRRSVSDDETIYTEEIVTYHHPVQPRYHGLLIGKKGSTLKRIRIETGTRIDINRERDTIMIKGTIDKIEKAKKVIDQMIQRAFETSRPTHFISLPIVSAFATRKLTEFQSAILSPGYSCDGIDPSILVIPENLHITLGVCKLLDQAEIERAVRFLKTQGPLLVKEHLLSNKKRFPTVQLKQLRIMQSDPEHAHVLYIEPKEEEGEALSRFSAALIDKMVQEDLMIRDDRPLKMHVTLINTSHRKNESSKEKRKPFDARPILKEFGDLDFGTVQLDKLHLMKMGRTGPGGTYTSEGSISLGHDTD